MNDVETRNSLVALGLLLQLWRLAGEKNMRVYDVALVVVRTTAAVELIHSVIQVLYTALRYTFLIGEAQGSAWLNKVELSTWMYPVEMAVFGVILLAVSKRVAKFAAAFAVHDDAARQF
jgi:hypothetical protein